MPTPTPGFFASRPEGSPPEGSDACGSSEGGERTQRWRLYKATHRRYRGDLGDRGFDIFYQLEPEYDFRAAKETGKEWGQVWEQSKEPDRVQSLPAGLARSSGFLTATA